MTEPQTAIPAATLVVFRDAPLNEKGDGGAPELLMVERAKAMVFAGGALVFPGGRVDPGDYDLAGGDEEDAHRIAAVRETVEEAGLPIGLDLPDGAVGMLRAALHGGADFGTALEFAGGRLRLDALVPFARWRPAHLHMRIFDTRFYLARLPEGSPAATVDRTENTRLLWASAAQVLADADAGRATIIYPTRRNLERLALFHSFDAATAQARAIPVRTITPFEAERDGVRHLCIPDDLGYPVTSEAMGAALRG